MRALERSVTFGPEAGQDRVAIRSFAGGVVVVVADGAGGTSHGADAAARVVALVDRELPRTAADCARLLSTIDVATGGETTAILLVASEGTVRGASVGDSSAWHIGPHAVLDLTVRQSRKPLLGSGRAAIVPFEGPFVEGRLVVGSDGLFSYVHHADLVALVRSEAWDKLPASLVAAAQLPSGGYHDDVAVVVVEHGDTTPALSAAPPVRLEGAEPVLPVRHVERALAFYASLGFSEVGRDRAAEPSYAVVARGGVTLHLARHDERAFGLVGDRPTCRIRVADVDALFHELVATGLPLDRTDPMDTAWGTRELHLRDPDRNALQFYRERPAPPAPR